VDYSILVTIQMIEAGKKRKEKKIECILIFSIEGKPKTNLLYMIRVV